MELSIYSSLDHGNMYKERAPHLIYQRPPHTVEAFHNGARTTLLNATPPNQPNPEDSSLIGSISQFLQGVHEIKESVMLPSRLQGLHLHIKPDSTSDHVPASLPIPVPIPIHLQGRRSILHSKVSKFQAIMPISETQSEEIAESNSSEEVYNTDSGKSTDSGIGSLNSTPEDSSRTSPIQDPLNPEDSAPAKTLSNTPNNIDASNQNSPSQINDSVFEDCTSYQNHSKNLTSIVSMPKSCLSKKTDSCLHSPSNPRNSRHANDRPILSSEKEPSIKESLQGADLYAVYEMLHQMEIEIVFGLSPAAMSEMQNQKSKQDQLLTGLSRRLSIDKEGRYSNEELAAPEASGLGLAAPRTKARSLSVRFSEPDPVAQTQIALDRVRTQIFELQNSLRELHAVASTVREAYANTCGRPR